MDKSEDTSSTAEMPTESDFIPLKEGTPFGVVCVIHAQDGRYICSDLGESSSSQYTQTKQQKIFSAGYSKLALWRLKPANVVKEWETFQWNPSSDQKSLVRFEHLTTTRNLHSHENFSLDDYGREVTGYGNFGRGDGNDDWELNEANSLFTIKHSTYKGILCVKRVPDEPPPGRDEEIFAIDSEILRANSGLWNTSWIVKFLPLSMPYSAIMVNEEGEDISCPLITVRDRLFINKTDVPDLGVEFEVLPKTRDFFNEERSKWNFISYQKLVTKRDAIFGDIISRLEHLMNNWATQSSEKIRHLALSCLLENVKNDKWPWSWHLPGSEILKNAASNNVVATWATAICAKLPGCVQDAQASSQSVYYTEAKFLLLDAQGKGKEKGPSQSNEKDQSAILERQEKLEKLSEIIKQSEDTIHKLLGKARSKSIESVASFDTLIHQGTDDLASLKSRYEEAIKTSSIEADLSTKSKSHRTLFWWFLVFAILVGAGSFALIIGCILPHTMQVVKEDEDNKLHDIMYATDSETQKAIAALAGHTAWFAYLKIGILITLALYVTRLLVKLAMSQFHQWQDASERLVLLRTYYTILQIIEKKGDKFSDAERAIVIGSIYRSGTIGVVKDEHGSSFNLAEIVAKALEK